MTSRTPTATSKRSGPASGSHKSSGRAWPAFNIDKLERDYPRGLSVQQIIDLFNARGAVLSEATFRKYVQLGLLPRSVRVGQKGKHRGSQGLYPTLVLKRLWLIRDLMQRGKTIDEIRQLPELQGLDVHSVSQQIRLLIGQFERSLAEFEASVQVSHLLGSELSELRARSEQLIAELHEVENRLQALSRMRYAAV